MAKLQCPLDSLGYRDFEAAVQHRVMELIGITDAKRQKTLHITSEQENDVVLSTKRHPVIPFEQAEEEMAEIMQLSLVKDAEIVGDESAANAVDDGMGLKEKTTRSEALEQLQKAYGELSQLMTLTENVNSQENLVLLTKTLFGEKEGDDSTVMQRMALTQQRMMSVQEPLNHEHRRLTELVKQRQAFSKSLERLGRVWRLLIRSPKLSIVGRKSKKAISAIGIDCGFGGCDGESLWVPLSVGEENREGYAELPYSEKERRMKCLCLQLEHIPSKSTLARVLSWQAAKESVIKWSDSRGFEGHNVRDECHEKIHIHCQQRQHESLSREIMEACKKEASTGSDRWVATGGELRTTATAGEEKEGNEKANRSIWPQERVWAALATERISETLDVTALNRGRVEVLLSEGLALTLSLQPLDQAEVVENTVGSESSEARALSSAMTRALLKCEGEYVAHLRRRLAATAAFVERTGDNGANITKEIEPEEPPLHLLRAMCEHIGRVGLLKEH